MKSKIIFSAILSAILLTACNSGGESRTPIESTETTSQTVSESAETETVPETTTVAASETEEETTTTAAETIPPKIENISGDVTLDIEAIDISSIFKTNESLNSSLFFADDIAVVRVYRDNFKNSKAVRIFDINDLSVKAEITAPDGWDIVGSFYPCIRGDGDVLCKIQLYRYNSETTENEYAAIIVRNDFTTEFTEDEPQKNLSIPAGNHNISNLFYDIVDADSGTVLVEGVEDNSPSGFGNMSQWYDYKFQIDNDRFVYRTCGIEWMPSFGYYDFTNGTAVDFPESRDFIPIGYHDGKIYAEETCWDGMCQGELYTFDIQTLEKKHFMSSPAEFETSTNFIEYVEYSMPDSGKYLVAYHRKYDYTNLATAKASFYIISPDSGETLAKCELNTIGIDYDPIFIDDSKFAAYDSKNDEIIIFNVKM